MNNGNYTNGTIPWEFFFDTKTKFSQVVRDWEMYGHQEGEFAFWHFTGMSRFWRLAQYCVFSSIDPRKEGTKYAQGAPSPDNKHSSYLLVTGLVVVAVLACFFGATYLYIKRKYGSMSSAVQQMQVQYSNGRRAVWVKPLGLKNDLSSLYGLKNIMTLFRS